ncbi:MAG: hypothetical protein ABSB61_12135 [Anaerolineales bacterium]
MASSVDRFVGRIRHAWLSMQLAALQLTFLSRYSVLLGSALDITRGNAQLVAENALLRRQSVILS